MQFPTPSQITKDLGLDTLPTVDADVMSVNIGEAGEEPMIFYRDPMELMTHLAEKHGTDAVMGMAELIGWSQGPAKALGRFDVRKPPKTIDEMYACATNEAERRAIHEMLFGSAMDVIDRYLPDKDKHAVHARHARVPRHQLHLPRALHARQRNLPGVRARRSRRRHRDDDQARGRHRRAHRAPARDVRERGGEIRYRTKVEKILVDGEQVTGVRCATVETISAPVVVSNLSPDTTLTELVGAEHLPGRTGRTAAGGRDHRASFVQMHFALDGLPEFAPPYDFLNEPGMQQSVGIFGSPEEQQRQWEKCRPRHRPGQSVDGHADPVGARPRHGAARQACRERVRLRVPGGKRAGPTRPTEKRDGAKVIDKISRLRPELQGHPDPAHHVRAVPHEHDVRRARPATSATVCCIRI